MAFEISFDPCEPQALLCLAAYFRDLDARFEGGFTAPADLEAELAEMTPPGGAFALAWRGGEVLGCGGFKRIDSATVEIKRVWTKPEARGLGVARRLLGALEEKARAMGAAVARLDTNKSLTEAQAFYRKANYAETARFNDNPYAHHWFVKNL